MLVGPTCVPRATDFTWIFFKTHAEYVSEISHPGHILLRSRGKPENRTESTPNYLNCLFIGGSGSVQIIL
jgi:hypothetical protein